MSDLQAVERLINPDGPVSRRARYANVQFRAPYRIVRRFRQLLPMHGALSWFLRDAIEEFVLQTGDITDEQHLNAVRERVARLVKKPPRRSRSRRE